MTTTPITQAEYNAGVAAQMREGALQAQVERLARTTGWLTYHTYTSVRSAPGFPDLVMVRRDRIIYAELKSARGALTSHQREWLTSLATAGAETYIWRPIDLIDGTVLRTLEATSRPDPP